MVNLQTMFKAVDDYQQSQEDEAEKQVASALVYFNSEGRIIPILKRTIETVIPGSQLAIRVCSGRWEEQEKDLDEDGNIDLEGSKQVFGAIVTSIRSQLLLKTKMPVQLSKQSFSPQWITFKSICLIFQFNLLINSDPKPIIFSLISCQLFKTTVS
jgi:hypothetical protein